MGFAVRDALSNLAGDEWRRSNDFSEELQDAHRVLLHPFATESDKVRVLSAWLKKYQPCVFGRVAAQMSRIHFCVLSDTDFQLSDEDLKLKIQAERRFWKQRCLYHEKPEDGFLLWAISPRIAYASPNAQLYELAQMLRRLYIPDGELDLKANDISWETLYLSLPDSSRCFRFRFSLDFFASQGDGRWWHDHRIPGGIAFTANSVGYMTKSRQWYENKANQSVWALKLAMETVDEAFSTKWGGKAIYLRNKSANGPFHGGECPFGPSERLKPRLEGKDWSYYSGVISTDHSVRKELFREDPDRPQGLPEWNMDLRYIYDPGEPAFEFFTQGEEVACADVVKEIGDPRSRRILASSSASADFLRDDVDHLERKWSSDESSTEDIWS
jgi:hypothetical protein